MRQPRRPARERWLRRSLVAAVAVAALVVPSTAGALGQRVYFSSYRFQTGPAGAGIRLLRPVRVERVAPDGSHWAVVGPGGGAQVSPDGRLLALARDRALWVYDARSGRIVWRVTDLGLRPRAWNWEPGSQRLLFWGSDGLLQQFDSGRGMFLGFPGLLTDVGLLEAAVSSKGVLAVRGVDALGGFVGVLERGRSKPRVLARLAVNQSGVAWNAAGSEILFADGGGLRAVDARSRKQRRVTDAAADSGAVESPDGRWVAFRRNQVGLMLVHPDGSGLHTLRAIGRRPSGEGEITDEYAGLSWAAATR